MQDPAYELPRIHIPRTPVDKGKKKGRSGLVMVRNTRNADATKEKGQKVGAAS